MTEGMQGLVPQTQKTKISQKPSGTFQKYQDQPKSLDPIDMAEDDLRDFLIKRIAQLKSTDKINHDEAHKFNFKASTIANIVPSNHAVELDRLEKNYKNRLQNKGQKLHQRIMTH